MVVTGIAGAEVTGTTALSVTAPEAAATLEAGIEGATVGIRVMVEGMAVTMPGFSGTQVAQIPVKYDRADWISLLLEPQA